MIFQLKVHKGFFFTFCTTDAKYFKRVALNKDGHFERFCVKCIDPNLSFHMENTARESKIMNLVTDIELNTLMA